MLVSGAAAAGPEPTISFDIQHYTVSGTTTTEIDNSMVQNTPVMINGVKYGAITKNNFQTQYVPMPTSYGGCEVKDARVLLKSIVVLPELAEGQHSVAVMAEWNRYMAALIDHEKQHAQNGKRIAQSLLLKLYNIRSDLPCQVMKPRLDQAISQHIRNVGAWDIQFDAETNHGESQGASLRRGIR